MNLLNPFPQLLTYSFFAPTLLRVAVACVLAYLAYRHYQQRDEIGKTNFPIVGRGMWVAWAAVIVEAGVALALFFGYHTQINAIVVALIALKHVVWGDKYPKFLMLDRTAALLLLVIAISLLMTGAGAQAFDLPL